LISDERPVVAEAASPLEERLSRADRWEAGADERERLADERNDRRTSRRQRWRWRWRSDAQPAV
jgi:hypothetical protein